MLSRSQTVLFFLVILALCSWHLNNGPNDNCVSRAAMVQAIVEQGTLRIDDWHERTGDKALIDGHYYSDKAPLPALLVVPFWRLADATGLAEQTEQGHISNGLLRLGGFLCGSLPLALIIMILWLRLRNDNGGTRIPAALLATLPLFGSFLFVFSGSFFGHLLGALFLVLAWLARDRPWLMGLLAGAAVLCEYPLFLFPAWWLADAVLRRRWRDAAGMIAGGLPALITLLAYNTALTGDPFSIGYDHEAQYTFMRDGYGFGLPSLEAMWGLSFSPYRGLFFYMPVLLIALVALVHAERRPTLLLDPILAPAILSFVAISCYGMWWGGWTYGPRHLTAVAVLLAYRSLPALAAAPWAKWPFIVLAGFGLLCAFAAKSTEWFSMPTGQWNPMRSVVLHRLGQGAMTEMQLPCWLGAPPAAGSLAFVCTFALAMILITRMDRGHRQAIS